MEGTEIARRDDVSSSSSDKYPAVAIVPLIYAHLAMTGDLAQHRKWTERLEKQEQSSEIEAASDPAERAVIANNAAWKRIRMASWLGASWTMLIGAAGTSWLMWEYAINWGFGWLAAASFLLPMPIAWAVSRSTFQTGATKTMKGIGRKPTGMKRLIGVAKGAAWSGGAGFAMGFTLVFLQGLISWFMTPAPTLFLELWWDVYNAVIGGLIAGTFSLHMAPLLARRVPDSAQLTEGDRPSWVALPDATK